MFIFQSTIARLSTLKVAVSHTYLYKKLDEFGEDHTKLINEAVTRHSQYMAQGGQLSLNTIQARAFSEPQPIQQHRKNNIQPDVGRKITFDNLDHHQEVHYMTEEHQNIDQHYVTVMSTDNRVHGHHLSDKPPETGVLNMENGKCLPNPQDNVRQRDNYITLVERITASSIPCLNFLSHVVTTHIPHQYSKEKKNASDTVSISIT